MSYQGVDRQRLRYLLAMGSELGEIDEFFKNCRTQLIGAGALLHKLSDKKEARIDFLSRLKGRPADVFAKWIAKRLSVEKNILPEALIAQFKALEASPEKSAPANTKSHARLGLYYLYEDSPPDVWLSFLRSPMDRINPRVVSLSSGSIDEDLTAAPSTVEAIPVPSSRTLADATGGAQTTVPTRNDISAIAAALETSKASLGSPHERHNEWITVAIAIAKLWRDPELQPDKLLEAIQEGSIRKELSCEFAAIRNSWLTGLRAPQGLELRDPLPMSVLGDLDGDRVQVLGRCVSETATATAAFIEPYGLLVGDEVFELDGQSARVIFPGTGQIIGFPGPAYPLVGEFGTFITERYQSAQPIKFRIRARGIRTYTVINLPVASTDPDAIRESVKATTSALSADFIFRLSDGLLVKTQGDEQDPLRYNYDVPLMAWRRLTGWRIGDRVIILEPLPPPDIRLDCSDLAAVLKTLLEDEKAVEDWPKLSRANVRTLIDYVRDQESLLSERRLRRLERELETFIESREGLESVVKTVLKSEKVNAEFEIAKQSFLREYEATRSDLVRARQGLENDITQLKAARARLQADKKKMASEVATAIGKAFEKAQANGLETLANVAVLEALLDRGGTHTEHDGAGLLQESRRASVEIIQASKLEPHEVLRSTGIRTSDARSIAHVLKGASDVGLPIALNGNGAGYLARRLAVTLCRSQCAIVDVHVGMVQKGEINTLLANLGPEIDLVLFRTANYSDFSAYGIDIETEMLDRLSGDPSAKPRSFLFSFDNGPAGLPVPLILNETCLKFDFQWLSIPMEEIPIDASTIEERLESLYRPGIGKLKIDAIKKLVRLLESKSGIGEFWMTIILNNLDGAGTAP